MKSIFSNFFRANLVSTLHSFWWFSLFIVFLTTKNLFATDYTITVTASGTSHYTLNNAALGFTDADDPNITVTWSDRLIFDISTIKSIHPLAIVDQLTADDGYDVANRVDFVLNNGDGENTVEWNLNGVTPGTYYYICTNHKFMKKDSKKHFPSEGEATLCGTLVECDDETGLAIKIETFISGRILKNY